MNVNQEDQEKMFHLPIPENHKALRAWTAAPKDTEEVVVIAEFMKDGNKVLMSAGRGPCLGQDAESSATFQPVKLPEGFQCEDIEVFKYKVAAISKEGKLYQWGKFKNQDEVTKLPEL
jgi:hypothetical protein